MRAVVKSLVDRAKNLYNASEMQQELNKINSSKNKQKNGYPKKFFNDQINNEIRFDEGNAANA